MVPYVKVGDEFDVIRVGMSSSNVTSFYIDHPSGTKEVMCIVESCSFLGEGEWELINDTTIDDYDRAMGVL